jgi:hypothetical protein
VCGRGRCAPFRAWRESDRREADAKPCQRRLAVPREGTQGLGHDHRWRGGCVAWLPEGLPVSRELCPRRFGGQIRGLSPGRGAFVGLVGLLQGVARGLWLGLGAFCMPVNVNIVAVIRSSGLSPAEEGDCLIMVILSL